MLGEVLDAHGDALASEIELPRRLLDDLGAIPSYYLKYFYAEHQALEWQAGNPPRAQTVAELERELLELYRDPGLDSKPRLLEQRGGAFYSEAATQLVASLSADRGDIQIVDTRNDGTLGGLAEDDVVEVPARIGRDGPRPIRQPELAPELLGLIQHVAAYERLAARAATTRDPELARMALLANPLVREYALAERLLDELLAAERERAGTAEGVGS